MVFIITVNLIGLSVTVISKSCTPRDFISVGICIYTQKAMDFFPPIHSAKTSFFLTLRILMTM